MAAFGYVGLFSLVLFSLRPGSAYAEAFVADPNATRREPDHYLNIVARLRPGDTLMLPAGTYRNRLNLNNLQGTATDWITITGPDSGAPAIITTDSTCCNTVQLGNSAYIEIRNLTIDSNSEALNTSIDAINAKGGITHDITIRNNVIQGVSLHQQTVGISTKSTAWNWTVTGNTIINAGTGIYFGDSNGAAPFVAGLIANNLFIDTIGYNMQIKYQNAYTPPPGMPTGSRKTIIRDNVFLKRTAQSSLPEGKVDGPRPNLLVGGSPSKGAGSDDLYEIYGNFFYENRDDESLIQASGRVSIHDNVFVGGTFTGILLRDHDRPLQHADVYNNTVYGGARGIRFASTARQSSSAIGNLVFSDTPISGNIDFEADNIGDSVQNAAFYVNSPSTVLGQMDFYPLPGQAQGPAMDLSRYSAQTDYLNDFNGQSKSNREFRGAYAGQGTNPGWQLDAVLKDTNGGSARP